MKMTVVAEKKFYNREGKEVQRTKCQVYTRVMGYLRPVSHYNQGKKTEFYSRKYFLEGKYPIRNFENEEILTTETMIQNNRDFISQYAEKVVATEKMAELA